MLRIQAKQITSFNGMKSISAYKQSKLIHEIQNLTKPQKGPEFITWGRKDGKDVCVFVYGNQAEVIDLVSDTLFNPHKLLANVLNYKQKRIIADTIGDLVMLTGGITRYEKNYGFSFTTEPRTAFEKVILNNCRNWFKRNMYGISCPDFNNLFRLKSN